MLSVRFWGVRGSIPAPGPDTVIYGGNTTCLEIRADERLFIIDMGTGIRPLGDWLMANDFKKHGKIDADILITHTHWDHIIGFPVFTPIFIPSTVLRVTGPVSIDDKSLKSIIEAQFSYNYWPVNAVELSARIEYSQIRETALDLGGGLTVTSKLLNHPILCLGYRFDYQGKSIAAVFDHEPFRNLFSEGTAENTETGLRKRSFNETAAKEGEITADEENAKIINFIKDADIVIHDAQYTEPEYLAHLGWGHASYDYAIKSAESANVKNLVLFHHDPNRTDSQLEELERSFADNAAVKIMMAKEGVTLGA